MEILAGLVLVSCGCLLGVFLTSAYRAWNDARTDEEIKKRILEGRVLLLEAGLSRVEEFGRRYKWRIERAEERLAALEAQGEKPPEEA